MAKLIICLVVLFAFKAFSAEVATHADSINAQVEEAKADLSLKQLENIKKSIKKTKQIIESV